jgi:uncharacterized membrane protein YtjA (UPF0391 family)
MAKPAPAAWHGECEPEVQQRRNGCVPTNKSAGGFAMLYYAIVFFVIALVAALFGFGGIAAGAAGIAKILFFAFLIIAIVTFLMSLAKKS